MAKVQVIPVEKKEMKPNLNVGKNTKKGQSNRPPLFRKTNYILMILGVVILAIGYICLAGGGSDDPSAFTDAIFNTRRLDVAPILMVVGLVIEIFAIMWHPKQKPEATAPENTPEN